MSLISSRRMLRICRTAPQNISSGVLFQIDDLFVALFVCTIRRHFHNFVLRTSVSSSVLGPSQTIEVARRVASVFSTHNIVGLCDIITFYGEIVLQNQDIVSGKVVYKFPAIF